MERMHGWKLVTKLVGVVLLFGLAPAPGWAALGESESSVSADAHVLRGQLSSVAHQSYQLHQITDASGAVIREYVSPAGKVFGVAWQGPFVPNLQQLLGTYFAYLQEYARAQTGRHGGPLVIQKENFVFSSGGHMRWRYGHAYVPSLLPANVSAEVVQ